MGPRGFVLAIEPVPENGSIELAPKTTSAPSSATPTRLAVLEIAARFLATRPDAKSADVLAIAEKWEAWVGR